MRRSVSGVLVLACSALLLTPPHVALSQDGTEVSGSISSDTYWGISGSPYRVVGDLTVEPGAHLSLEKGVKVIASRGISFVIRGSLDAPGTPQGEITFTCTVAIEECWSGLRVTQGSGGEDDDAIHLDHAFIEFAEVGTELQPGSGGAYISDTLYRFNEVAAVLTPIVRADRNLFVWSGGTGVVGGGPDVKHNLVAENGGVGVELDPATAGAEQGIFSDGNSILDNGTKLARPIDMRARSNEAWSVDATGNWWGTFEAAEIERRIVDGRDETGNQASVEFEPFLQTKHAQVRAVPPDESWTKLDVDMAGRVRAGEKLDLRFDITNRTERDCLRRWGDADARLILKARARDGRPRGAIVLGRAGSPDERVRQTKTLQEDSVVTLQLRHEIRFCRVRFTKNVDVRG